MAQCERGMTQHHPVPVLPLVVGQLQHTTELSHSDDDDAGAVPPRSAAVRVSSAVAESSVMSLILATARPAACASWISSTTDFARSISVSTTTTVAPAWASAWGDLASDALAAAQHHQTAAALAQARQVVRHREHVLQVPDHHLFVVVVATPEGAGSTPPPAASPRPYPRDMVGPVPAAGSTRT
jgi:hypothetical protein